MPSLITFALLSVLFLIARRYTRLPGRAVDVGRLATISILAATILGPAFFPGFVPLSWGGDDNAVRIDPPHSNPLIPRGYSPFPLAADRSQVTGPKPERAPGA